MLRAGDDQQPPGGGAGLEIFVGHLDEIRNVSPLLTAINALKENDSELGEKVEFIFHGNMSNTDKLYIMDNQLFDVVKKEKAIDYQQSLEEEKDELVFY